MIDKVYVWLIAHIPFYGQNNNNEHTQTLGARLRNPKNRTEKLIL